MAFNWDKFCKAQRDYPKPKFALDAAGKLLKKRPSDPYLLAWKASTLLKMDGRAQEAHSILTSLCQQQPPVTDPNLLSFIYDSSLDALRQSSPTTHGLLSVGAEGLKAWQNAAKALPNQRTRLKLWSDLFVVAMKEECWEDVRWAITHANKEGTEPKYRKASYYSMILANQLAGEKSAAMTREAEKEQGGRIQLALAHRQMKAAYDALPKDEAFQVTSMSDLRFMAAIYERQNRCAELFQLWDSPPPPVKKTIDRAAWDFAMLGIEVARRQQDWPQVETRCYRLIDKIWQSGDPSEAKANMLDICTRCWSVWESLLDATSHLYSKTEQQEKIEKIYSRIWKSLPPSEQRTDRAIDLTKLTLESYIGHPILETITQFYYGYHRNPSCFEDLRRFVISLPEEEQKQFQSTIGQHSHTLSVEATAEVERPEETEKKIQQWHEAETNVLKFELLIISLPEEPDIALLEIFVEKALRLWRLQLAAEGTEKACGSDALIVAVEALGNLFEITTLSPYLYQAAALTRYALSLDKQQHCKKLALLSTRLHMRIGLGTFAFEHYSRIQVKEMLHDNVGWVLLSRISQSHPFGASGPRGFSADSELEKVISTLSRMEKKIDDLLYAGLQQFVYDKALELLELKQKLRTSLTKHFCIIERRRIARLAGRRVDATLSLPLHDPQDISDNCDWDAVPAVRRSQPEGSHSTFLMPSITKIWVQRIYALNEVVNAVAFQEFLPNHVSQSGASVATEVSKEGLKGGFTLTENGLTDIYWKPIGYLFQAIADTASPLRKLSFPQIDSYDQAFDMILRQLDIDIDEIRQFVADASEAPEAFNSDPERAPHPSEDMLNALYGRLEAVKVLNRLVGDMRSIAKSKTHALRKDITVAKCDRLQKSVTEFFRLHTLRIHAIIDRLQRSGKAMIAEQLPHGKTGAAVGEVISSETLSQFSKEYNDSAIEALKGFLRIELD